MVTRRNGGKTNPNGNTMGRVVGETSNASVAAAGANPSVPAETEEEKGFWKGVGDWLKQQKDDVAAAIDDPGAAVKGFAKDLANTPAALANFASVVATASAGSDLAQSAMYAEAFGGDPAQARAMSEMGHQMMTNPAASAPMINEPFTLDTAAERGGALLGNLNPKGAVRGAGKVATKGATRGARNAAEEGAEAAGDASRNAGRGGSGGNRDGGRVRPRPRRKVKCFCASDHAMGGRDEYERQLKNQQAGINSMSADKYLTERRAYTGKNPCAGYADTPEGVTKQRGSTRSARRARTAQQKRKYMTEFENKGMSPDQARRMGSAKANRELGNQAALHNQDMVAGGIDIIGAIGADGQRILTDADFGWSDTNSHIGTQWNGDRVSSIDEEACQMQREGLGDQNMDVELRPCGKREARKMGCHETRKRRK